MREDFEDSTGLYFDRDRFVSAFEVLAVLAIRIEDEQMQNSKYGDRTDIWFWDMMSNLDLDYYRDTLWNDHNSYIYQEQINDILENWMNRDYSYDGSNGGIVILREPREDLRNVDLWYQLMWWLVENHPEECTI